MTVSIHDASLDYGETLVASGRIASTQAGQRVALQARDAGTTAFRTVKTGTTTRGGRFRLASALRRNAVVRVIQTSTATAAAADATAAMSRERGVRVGADITTERVRKDVITGHEASVSGAVRPSSAGRHVALQVQRDGRWSTVARASTARGGRFTLRYTPRAAGSPSARVRFSGDRANAPSAQTLGALNAYRRAQASWYGPGLYGHGVACGGHLSPGRLGVANKTLPCGTKLTLRYHGRSVRVSVIDRGPYVAGREFDLTYATKQRLGFPGVGYVLTTR